jgi:predicted phosphodiesterase
VVRALVAAGLGALVALVAMTLIPATRSDVGPASISAKAVLGPGRSHLVVPPLGAVSATTHHWPLTVSLGLVEVDVNALAAEVVSDSPGAGLVDQVEDDLRDLGRGLVIRLVLGGLVLGAIALGLIPGRRWQTVVAGSAGGGLATLLLVGGTAITFNVEAFDEPRFTGALQRAPVVLEALNKQQITIPQVRSRYETAAGRLSELLTLLTVPDADPRDETVALLHVSDIHSNPIGIEIARQLASQFDVDAIVDSGDLTNFGVHLETRIAELVGDMPAPYYFVAGNHDSLAVQLSLEELDNVTVLDGDTTAIEGIEVLGIADPTYTNWNRLPPGEAADIRLEAGDEVAEQVAALQPDVLLVHDRRLAEVSLGQVPLILSGHYHKQILDQQDGTRILAVGSTGASGLTSFTLDAMQNYEAEIVYFRDATAVAIDYVRFSGLGADFEITRATLDPLIEEENADEVEEGED